MAEQFLVENIREELTLTEAAMVVARHIYVDDVETIIDDVNSKEFQDDSAKLKYLTDALDNFVLKSNEEYNKIINSTHLKIVQFTDKTLHIKEGANIVHRKVCK